MEDSGDRTYDLFEDHILQGEPVYTLAECLAAKQKVKEAKYPDDETTAQDPSEIRELFRKTLSYCDERALALIRHAEELSKQKAGTTLEAINYYPFWLFHNWAFIYLFENDGSFYLVLPEELAAIYHEVIADEDFAPANARNLELISYATALAELYGIFEIDQFIAVWNHHHKEKITPMDAVDFLIFYQEFGADFFLDKGFAIHDSLNDDEFDDLWEKTYYMKYYMPTKSVIRECNVIRHDFDYKIPGEKEMDDFLAAYINDEQALEIVQVEIVSSCKRLKSPEEVRKILDDAETPIDDAAFVAEFEKLYNTLRDNTHIWELRGHTIYQFQKETNQIVPRFRLA